MPVREWCMAKAQFAIRDAFHKGYGLIMFNRPPTHEIPDTPPPPGFGIVTRRTGAARYV